MKGERVHRAAGNTAAGSTPATLTLAAITQPHNTIGGEKYD